jgi:choline dehydrogenase-like flavoprotein
MILDGEDLPDGTVLDGELVVVGAGPAGIVTALEAARAGVDVVLLESGGMAFDQRAQALADAAELDVLRHAPMSMTTQRNLGGTSVIWGGRCVPFDLIDFDPREHVHGAAWPIDHAAVDSLAQRACDWLICGRAVFDARRIPHLAKTALVPGLPDGDVCTTTLERWSLPTDFGREYAPRLERSGRVRVFTGTTCTQVVCRGGAPQVAQLDARTLGGRRLTVRGKRYVLACGGLETTRLLLASPGPGGREIGNHSDHLGRWYMAHMEGSIARVRFTTDPRRTLYGYERDVDGVYVRRRFSFRRAFALERGLPNIVGWLANSELPDPSHQSGVLSLAYLALASPLGRAVAPDAQRQSLTGVAVPGAPYGYSERGPVLAHVRNIVKDARATARFISDFGYHRFVPHRRAPGFFAYRPDNVYPLQYHGEHMPSRNSRVSLSDERDALGMAKLRIDLRFCDADVDGVVRAHRHWDDYLRSHGQGWLEYTNDDVAASIWERAGGGFHQSGTTRMSASPDDGVLDRDLAVHGFRDLFVASSSAFVTSSQANSTFMIVALALRLADTLTADLKRR